MAKKVTQPRKRKSNKPLSGDEATIDSTPRVEIGASAKVEATAKYEVKKTVHEVIPEDVTRAKACTWLTILSPITQWAGMKGDEIAYKRSLLRLQREETLAEIAKRVKPKIRSITEPTPVPTKFLVPFLEKASLEDAGSDLTELWANLLVSAAQDYDPQYVHFINIIAQISSRQARAFMNLLGTNNATSLEDIVEYTNIRSIMESSIKRQLEAIKYVLGDRFYPMEFIEDLHVEPGIDIVYYDILDGQCTFGKPKGDDIDATAILAKDYAVLEAMGLTKFGEMNIELSGGWRISVMFYGVTSLGIEFAKACCTAKC